MMDQTVLTNHDGKIVNNCDHSYLYFERCAAMLGIPHATSFEYIKDQKSHAGAHCDCELLFQYSGGLVTRPLRKDVNPTYEEAITPSNLYSNNYKRSG